MAAANADKTSKRLFVASYDYPPNDGGISRLVAGIVAELVRRGRVLTVLTLRGDGRKGPARPECEHVNLPRGRLRRSLTAFVRLMLLPRGTPVLTGLWNPEATLAWATGHRRVTILAHGNEVMPAPDRPRWSWLRGKVLTAAHAVVCNSHHTQDLVRSLAPGARTVVINPGVDLDRFAPVSDRAATRAGLGLTADQRVVLSVARLDPVKSLDTVIAALAAVAPPLRERLVYLIGGKGRAEAGLRQQVAALGLQGQVRFLGFVAETDLPALYAAADLFVLPSITMTTERSIEGFGMALAEAQAAGVPVIGTRSGGIPDAVIEGEGGWLIDEGDSAALSRHLERLALDPLPFAQQGARGLARVRRDLGWAHYVDRLLDVIGD